MDTILNDKRNKIIQTGLNNLGECIELVGEHFTGDEKDSQLNIIEQLARQYHEDKIKFDLSKAALKMTNDYFEDESNNQTINVEEIYKDSTKKCVNCIVPFNEHPDMKVIIHSLDKQRCTPGTSEDTNNSLIFTQATQLPVDPLTKGELRNPWKNKVCGHVYEYSTIMDYISSKKGSNLKCPYVGCANTNIRKTDLVEDKDLLMTIRESQPSTSFFQNSIQEIDD